MFLAGLTGLALVLLFGGTIVLARFAFHAENLFERLREIPMFSSLYNGLALTMEAGWPIHYAFGWGSLWGEAGGSALVSLSAFQAIGRFAIRGDEPPDASSGDGLVYMLGGNVLNRLAREQYSSERWLDRMYVTGFLPWGYAAGTLAFPLTRDTELALFLGHFGAEGGWLAEMAPRVFGGTDDLVGQAVLYSTCDEALVGEEVLAAGAYTQAGPVHGASLWAQDVMRWLLILILFLGAPVYVLLLGGGG